MAGTGFCPGCGAPTTPLTEICTACGERVPRATKGPTWKPTAAGILCIIAGVTDVIFGITIVVVGHITRYFLTLIGMGRLMNVVIAIGPLWIVLGIVAVVGGVYALSRRIWGLALAGSICALIGGNFILGILAITFVSLGKGEFE